MHTFTIPVASAKQIAAGWSGIESVERAIRASGDAPSVRQQTLRAELVAAGVEPPELDGILLADSIERAYERLARCLPLVDVDLVDEVPC